MKKTVATVALILLSIFTIFAQSADHKHGSPHGGIVKSSGDYHLEMKASEGMIMIYLLDGKEKAMKVGNATATATLQTEDGNLVNITLSSNKKDGFMTMLEKGKKFHKAIVTVVVNGKNVTGTFDIMEEKHGDKHSEHKH